MSSRKEKISLGSLCVFILSIIFICFFTPSFSYATGYAWIGGTGSWSDPSNWNPYGVPNSSSNPSGDFASITFSDSLDRTINGVDQALRIITGNTGIGHVNWNISQGANYGNSYGGLFASVDVGPGTILNMTGGALIADMGGQGFVIDSGAIVNNSGGSIILAGIGMQLNGTFNLSGNGRIEDYVINIGTGATLNQIGGIIEGSNTANIGILGTYNFIAGENDVNTVNFGQLNLLGKGIHTLSEVVNGGIINASGITFIENYIIGLDIVNGIVTDINGTPGTFIFYDPTKAENSYLEGLTYNLKGGGYLTPVPEPATILLLGLGLIGLAGVRGKFKK